MTDLDLDSSVPDWLVEYPALLSLFQELGIDYCCGGKSLLYACEEMSLDPHKVLVMIRESIQHAGSPNAPEH